LKAGSKELVLDLGHTGLLRTLLSKTGDAREEIEQSLKKKDFEQLEVATRKSSAPKSVKKVLLTLPELYGRRDILVKANKISLLKKFVKELEDVLDVLDEFRLECDLNIDLGELRGFNYYTGITFEIISPSMSSPLLRGGRYDDLVGKYGFDMPATGFAIDVESLLHVTKTTFENNQIHFVVIPKKMSLRRDAIRLSEWLRSSGFKVILDLESTLNLRKLRIKENMASNSYGVIFLETSKRIKLIESRSGVSREFSNLEELLKGGI